MSKTKETVETRAVWGRQLEFILTMVGYAVGLGNVWRFPYLCYKNGGGAFLVPYTLSLILLGIPVFGLEVSFGQFGGRGPISIWGINPSFKGVGYAAVISTVLVAIYYNVIIAWSLYYLVSSMTSVLPWSFCNDCRCILYNFMQNTTLEARKCKPTELLERVLNKTSSIAEAGELQTHLTVANLFGWALVLIVLSKGIQSLGKVVYFTALFPYVLLTILLVRVAMLDGALEGVAFYLTPDWSRLADANVWSDAAVQIFFSLSACQGGLIALSSYNKFNNNVLRDSLMVPIINCMTSFYAGFVVFSVLGYMAKIRGVGVGDVTKGGPGLAFVVYPEALSQMPISPLWAVLFFLMICMLGFSTAGGSYILDVVDGYVVGFPTLFVGLFELVCIAWVYGHKEFSKDVKAMIKRGPYKYFVVCWVFVSPLLLVGIIIFKAYQYVPLTANKETHFPWWSEMMAWGCALFPISFIPGWFYYYTCTGGLWKKIRELNMPLESWTSRRQLSQIDDSSRENGKSEREDDRKDGMQEVCNDGDNEGTKLPQIVIAQGLDGSPRPLNVRVTAQHYPNLAVLDNMTIAQQTPGNAAFDNPAYVAHGPDDVAQTRF
ncbi:hypothetical protein C0Q70_01675 [Pomacea canaliculata]|uniref:Transporter n=1 Tax=Pomacea canaliculata TaxID=400727 RepID=A0A2T7Q051_POMCA|nr:hypothetical protein C0Q70_01675 [Pomacea canaliculata]